MIEPVSLGFSTLIGKEIKTPFPSAFSASGQPIKVNRIPPREAQAQEFFYATELSDGWAGIRNRRTGTELKIRFDLQKVPYVWAFQSFGKWRGHYTLVLEPCTNVPWDLSEAKKRGTCATLAPGEQKEFCFEVAIEPSLA
jgi:hypothetical protein